MSTADEADDRWAAFRDAVTTGLDPERAARVAGLVDEHGQPHISNEEN